MCKLTKIFFFFLLSLSLACNLTAQVPVERSTEIVTISGKEFYMHRVLHGQTLYGISHAYNVSVEEIERLNPEVKDGLRSGSIIGIPVKKNEAVLTSENVEKQKVVPVSEKEPATQTVERPRPNPQEPESKMTVGGTYVVQQGESLYDIAKKFGIDLADFKAINPGLSNEPAAGTSIMVPNIVNENDYIVHKVELNERTTSMLKRWGVSEDEFREKNISVGSHVFVNQVVLIPIEKVVVASSQQEEEPQTDEEDQQGSEQDNIALIDEEITETPQCNILEENALQTYKVVLMVPLYLGDMGRLDVGKEGVAKAMKSRAMLFLNFYEGFMMAVDRLVEKEGLKLELTVMDVTDDANTAIEAVGQMDHISPDLIVGPFFANSFVEVENYAKGKGIIVVNPMSVRESILEGNPNVVKVKPGMMGQILDLSKLIKNHYSDANVFIVSKENDGDTLFLNVMERRLNHSVNENVSVSGEEMLEYARSESKRMEMGERLSPTVTVEGQVYSTSDLEANAGTDIVLENNVKRYVYSEMSALKSQLSGVRDNLIIAYGDNNVFATQVINTLKKEADRKPITLVALPDWTKFEKLLVGNLLEMNAIYLTDCFIDYRDPEVKDFVRRFRRKYRYDPHDYAFEGYDIAYYFLTALMRYGNDMIGCLPNHEMPLFHTRFHFMGAGTGNGMENQAWSLFQYDKEAVELNPINPNKTHNDE